MKSQRKTPRLVDDTSDFSCDIIQNILSRLPIKFLLRFKTVSKSWNAMIKDSGFAKIHSNQLHVSNSQCFFAKGLSGDGTYRLIKFQGQEFYEQSVVRYPLKEFQSAHFLCCCEGILLFHHYFQGTSEKKYVLWNPFTRNYSTFTCPHDDIIRSSYPVSYGLCLDKYEDDYKIIVVLIRSGKYLVYSIKNDCWAERQSGFRGYLHGEGTYADGVVYWTVMLAGSCCNTIIYFDPKDDLIKKQHKPWDLRHANSLLCLTNLRGNLCFYTRDRKRRIEIWLLKEYGGSKSWMKVMTADNRKWPVTGASDPIFCVPRPMYLTSNNEVVFQDLNSSSYAVYWPEEQKFGEAKFFPAHYKMIEFTCLESLNFPATPSEG